MSRGELIPTFGDEVIQLTQATNGNVRAAPGQIVGLWVQSSTAGTIAIYDDAATGTSKVILPSGTPLAVGWVNFPIKFTKGLNIVGGGTFAATLVIGNP
jgi:hypothetical protein